MGAQLGVYHLARHDPRVVGLIAVASQSPYHRGYPVEFGRKLRFGSIIMPLVGRVAGHVPGRFFGATGRVPADRVRDWAELAGTGVMQPARADLDYLDGLARVTVPALAVSIADDPLAPASAARNLLSLLPAAPRPRGGAAAARTQHGRAAPTTSSPASWPDRPRGRHAVDESVSARVTTTTRPADAGRIRTSARPCGPPANCRRRQRGRPRRFVYSPYVRRPERGVILRMPRWTRSSRVEVVMSTGG